MMAGQAAIAIDSAMMFSELQRSNIELSWLTMRPSKVYHVRWIYTIKRQKSTPFRVADMTLKLAFVWGGRATLIHIRRGAILHDIGKACHSRSNPIQAGASC